MLRDTGVPALLVTHDFAEAALLGDRVGVLDGGAIVQLGPAAELSARPASAFVADFTGAVVLTGVASPARDGLTVGRARRRRDDRQHRRGRGPVGASLYPWEIVLEAGSAPSSAQNHLAAEVVSITEIGGRARVGLLAGQPLVAEVSVVAVRDARARAGRAGDGDVEGRGDAAGATLSSTARSACSRVVSKTGTGESSAPTSRSISVQPSRMPCAPSSASARMIRRYSSREPSSTIPRQSSS